MANGEGLGSWRLGIHVLFRQSVTGRGFSSRTARKMPLLACGSNEVYAKGTDGRGNSSYERGKESLHARTKMAGVCSLGVS